MMECIVGEGPALQEAGGVRPLGRMGLRGAGRCAGKGGLRSRCQSRWHRKLERRKRVQLSSVEEKPWRW